MTTTGFARWTRLLLALSFTASLLSGCGYNQFQTKDEATKAAWSEVVNQYQRRADLIPNLVNTVKGYAAHESGTLEAVVQARNSAMSATGTAQQAQAENAITGALKSIFALSEAYPDLKANASFLNLQEELTGTEGRIAYARQYYNDAVQKFNTKTQTVPSSIIANMFGFKEKEYFEPGQAL